MTLTRKDVVKMINKKVAEVIVLSHHLSEYDEPHEGYVNEKTHPDHWPTMDKKRKEPFIDIGAILFEHFGIVTNPSGYP